MIKGSYNAEGAKALMAEGGTARLDQAKALIESLGGTLESMYFVWGTDDIVGFCEMPDDATAAAAAQPGPAYAAAQHPAAQHPAAATAAASAAAAAAAGQSV